MSEQPIDTTLNQGFARLLTAIYRNGKDAPDAVVDALGCLVAMAARIEALEQSVPAYRGPWKQKTPYARGSIVTFSGSMWHSNEDDNLDKPGASEAWTLCCKKGRDANPRKDATP